jgi:hypothetical protein
VSPEALPEVLPEKRDARRCLPSSGSRGRWFPTFLGTMRREDDPLPRSGRFAGRSLPDTVPASRVRGVPQRARDLMAAPRSRQGLWSPGPPIRALCTETGGPPTFPRYPSEDLPRSQTPVVSCALACLAHRMAAFRRLHTVGFRLDAAEAILLTTTLPISGLTNAACLLAPSSFARPLLDWHVEFAPARLARL